MSVEKNKLIAAISPPLPNDIVTKMLDEYQAIKLQYFLGKYRPAELDGARFAECVLRLVQNEDTGSYTPFGTSINSENIVNHAANNTGLHESLRLYIPRFARMLLDIRNRRDVAHVGGDVSPNLSDSLVVCHCADWTLTEVIRLFYNCSIDDAKKYAESINESKIPVVAEVDGFLRVQNTKLSADEKTMVILYHKNPSSVKDNDLVKWIRYANVARYKSDILPKLDAKALIHYERGICTLLPKGIAYVQSNIELNLLT